MTERRIKLSFSFQRTINAHKEGHKLIIRGGDNMEIWLVELLLHISDDDKSFETQFECRKFHQLFKDDGLSYSAIQPSYLIRLKKGYTFEGDICNGFYRVSIPYEYEPSDEELKLIELEMKNVLAKLITEKRDEYLVFTERMLIGLLNGGE